jgi:hypothetical protein
MNHLYHVTYYYLATGMEGHADTRDYGLYDAKSEDEAKEKAIDQNGGRQYDRSTRAWIKTCLTAKRMA